MGLFILVCIEAERYLVVFVSMLFSNEKNIVFHTYCCGLWGLNEQVVVLEMRKHTPRMLKQRSRCCWPPAYLFTSDDLIGRLFFGAATALVQLTTSKSAEEKGGERERRKRKDEENCEKRKKENANNYKETKQRRNTKQEQEQEEEDNNCDNDDSASQSRGIRKTRLPLTSQRLLCLLINILPDRLRCWSCCHIFRIIGTKAKNFGVLV